MPDTFGVPSQFTVNQDGSTTPPAAAGPGPACKLARITNPTLAVGRGAGWQVCFMDTAIYDPAGMMSGGLSGEIKITKAGLYMVVANVFINQFLANVYTGIGVFKNHNDPDGGVTAGDGLKTRVEIPGSPNQYPNMSVMGTIPCAVGDILTAYVEGDTSSNTDITIPHFSTSTSNNSYLHRLEAALVG